MEQKKQRMKKVIFAIVLASLMVLGGCKTKTKKSTTDAQKSSFKTAFEDQFYVGAAMDTAQILGTDKASLAIITSQFNTVTPENHMKAENIHPEKDRYDFEMGDKYVDFGLENDMKIIGHCLIWHSQLPDWFFKDDQGNQIGKEELIKRMHDHITTIVSHYKGKVDGWDVVNEAFENDGSYRKSPFYEILGKDYIKLAFEYALEADPDVELYYNDYSMNIPAKRDSIIKMVKDLKSEGLRVDGIGMQAHYSIDDPSIDAIEASIVAIEKVAKVMITELDITVLPPATDIYGADVSNTAEYQAKLNPYPDGLPDDITTKFNQRYIDLFNLFEKHADVIDRVTFWGVTDNQTWRNYWPVKGRTDYPLLFDRNYQPKEVVYDILKLGER